MMRKAGPPPCMSNYVHPKCVGTINTGITTATGLEIFNPKAKESGSSKHRDPAKQVNVV